MPSCPNDKKVRRKLKAIFSADVKGYSSLISEDEVFTMQTLRTASSNSLTIFGSQLNLLTQPMDNTFGRINMTGC